MIYKINNIIINDNLKGKTTYVASDYLFSYNSGDGCNPHVTHN